MKRSDHFFMECKRRLYPFTLKILCMCFLLFSTAKIFSRNFEVYTYANKPHIGLDYLVKSCDELDIDLKILGIGSANYQGPHLPFPNLLEKIKFLYTELVESDLADDDVVMFVDAFDVIFLKNKEIILERFLEANVPIIFGAENYFYLGWGANIKRLYPPSPTSFRYLNSGCMIGYVSRMREILKWVLDHPEKSNKQLNDQVSFTIYYLLHPGEITLDHYNRFVLNSFNVKKEALLVDEEKKEVFVRETNGNPCVLHGNGPEAVYKELRVLFYGE